MTRKPLKLSARQITLLKVIVFLTCLLPLSLLGWGLVTDTLGANPIETLIRDIGRWALKFLLITLAITPLRKVTGWGWLMRFRRMLGLYAFFYALIHLSLYLWLDQSLAWVEIAKDIIKRPFITVGMATFTILLVLAITSTDRMVQRLGFERWQGLHRAVYAAAILAVLHFWWLVKLDTTWPLIYTLILLPLLALRLFWYWRARTDLRANAA